MKQFQVVSQDLSERAAAVAPLAVLRISLARARRVLPRVGISFAVAALAACTIMAPPPPTVELPAAAGPSAAEIDRWWLLFNDPQLTALVEQALAANLDLQSALARIDEARANLRLARAAFYPSLDGNASGNRSQRSAATVLPQGPPYLSNTFDLGLQAAYEVDLWGRVRSGARASDASLLAARLDLQALRLTLTAQVADTYFTLRSLDAELAVTQATLTTREENVRLQASRAKAGIVSEYDLAQAQAERASVAATVPALQKSLAQTESALAVLTGRSARDVFAPMIGRGVELEQAATPPVVPAGLASDLLMRRPDVRRAEAQLATADARIAEARAQYFPRLTLTGSFGGESTELSDLLNAPARVWSLVGGLTQPIIGVNRISAEVDAASARRAQAATAYVQSVQTTLREVHDALVAQQAAQTALAAQQERRARLADALRLAELRYKNGYSSYLEVLDAQRGLLGAERDRIGALRDRQTALVDLYKALGGGWSPQAFAQSE